MAPPFNAFFFQLQLISWMVTLSSCLIWQTIRFILPLNEYGCTFEQRWEILQQYFENHDFGRREAPSAKYVRHLVKIVKETGVLIDKPKREKPNIVALAESARELPSRLIYRCPQQLNISETSLRQRHKDLGMTS